MVFLHGHLDIEVIEAKDLPNVDGLRLRFLRNKSDPYVTVDIGTEATPESHRLAKTRVIDNNLNPQWNESYRIELCHDVDYLTFRVKDKDLMTTDFLGETKISGNEVATGDTIQGWYVLTGKRKSSGELRVMVKFDSYEVGETESNEVTNTIFPMRIGCIVKLYQDAHTPAVPPVTDVFDKNGRPYDPPQLWLDLVKALEEAKKLIYVVGWAVKADVLLTRGGRNGEDVELGKLLKRKASEGIRVLVMVWDEAASSDVWLAGVMGTHDEETRIYFAGSAVKVLLAPRTKKNSRLRDQIYAMGTFTHHQKFVIVDTDVQGDYLKRRLVAFAGGIDLTDGRYDTPAHPLFETLPTDHAGDYYNKVCQSTANVGPRQPWHDIHMCVEGKVAHDLYSNFVERWRCHAPDMVNQLLHLNDTEFAEDWCAPPGDNHPHWNVQLFRSINSDSVHFEFKDFPKLLSRKGRIYECSIQKAYIHHIRRAKNFIYIENQYFVGSSHSWLNSCTKAPNLIPIELATRIDRAIKGGEDFRVYILIPMHSEGIPTSNATQEILVWQYRTISMMYTKIAKTIQEKGVNAHPTDYLSFFCLGKRECPDDVPNELSAPPANGVAWKVRQSLRFMIYIHSKLAIFDDEYIIIGSANINERSMSGNRDTEIALGAYQPSCTKAKCGRHGAICGEVHTFRRALWAEHCGLTKEEHKIPSSLECMKQMRALGEDNLHRYLQPEPIKNDSHIMIYPYSISSEGMVETRADCATFPDVGGCVMGKSSLHLPHSLTT